MTAQAEVQQQLELDGTRPMTWTEASRVLKTTKARVCELILEGHLDQPSQGYVDRFQVVALAEQQPSSNMRMKRAPDRLPRTTESGLWLLADWGGAARVMELAAALETSWQSTYARMQKTFAAGYTTRTDDDGQSVYTLTAEGWEYVRRYQHGLK